MFKVRLTLGRLPWLTLHTGEMVQGWIGSRSFAMDVMEM